MSTQPPKVTAPKEWSGAVHVAQLIESVYAVGAALDVPRLTKKMDAAEGWQSTAFHFAADVIRHFEKEEADKPGAWRAWDDTFAAYVADEIAEVLNTRTSASMLEVAAEMRLTENLKLATEITQEVEDSTASLDYLSRQWVERVMVRVVRHYYLDLIERKEAGQ